MSWKKDEKKKSKVYHNTFILDFQKNNLKISRKDILLSKIIKFFNPRNKYLKLKFKDDNLNRFFSIKYSPNFDYYEDLIDGNMINISQAVNIYHLLIRTILLKVPGEIVELGCFKGVTTMIMQKTLDQYRSNKRIHVYDSFQGLPEKTKKDGSTYFKKGFCRAEERDLIMNFKKAKLKLPVIHKGLFKDTLPGHLPNKISFAYLDGDFYTSTKEGLKHLYLRLSKGAIVVIDDYCDPKVHNVHNILPGVKRACDEFFKNKPEKMSVLISGWQSHGYFVKM